MLLLFLAVTALLIFVLFVYQYGALRRRKKAYPAQRRLVRALVEDLKNSRLDLILMEDNASNYSLTLSLFGIKNFLDNGRKLSRAKYDDHPLFFTDDSSQMINFEKYIHHKALPRPILRELLDFRNTAYTPVEAGNPCFIIITDTVAATSPAEGKTGELFSGNAEAFESWLSFKESAHSLNYVIRQWMRENRGLRKVKIKQATEVPKVVG